MSKYCSSCGRENNSNSNYCSNCGKSLESSNSSSNSSPSYSSNPPDGCVYDYMGHVRPDPDRLREDRERSQAEFRDRM